MDESMRSDEEQAAAREFNQARVVEHNDMPADEDVAVDLPTTIADTEAHIAQLKKILSSVADHHDRATLEKDIAERESDLDRYRAQLERLKSQNQSS